MPSLKDFPVPNLKKSSFSAQSKQFPSAQIKPCPVPSLGNFLVPCLDYITVPGLGNFLVSNLGNFPVPCLDFLTVPSLGNFLVSNLDNFRVPCLDYLTVPNLGNFLVSNLDNFPVPSLHTFPLPSLGNFPEPDLNNLAVFKQLPSAQSKLSCAQSWKLHSARSRQLQCPRDQWYQKHRIDSQSSFEPLLWPWPWIQHTRWLEWWCTLNYVWLHRCKKEKSPTAQSKQLKMPGQKTYSVKSKNLSSAQSKHKYTVSNRKSFPVPSLKTNIQCEIEKSFQCPV